MKVLKSAYPALAAWVEEQSLSLEEMETKVWKLPEFRGDFFIKADKKRESEDALGFFYCPYIPKMFMTDGQERMRIDAEGNVGLASATAQPKKRRVLSSR